MQANLPAAPAKAMAFMLFIAGMGGLLYGINVGINAGALPYLKSTASVAWKLSAQQLSFIVAALLLGSVLFVAWLRRRLEVFGKPILQWFSVSAGFQNLKG